MKSSSPSPAGILCTRVIRKGRSDQEELSPSVLERHQQTIRDLSPEARWHQPLPEGHRCGFDDPVEAVRVAIQIQQQHRRPIAGAPPLPPVAIICVLSPPDQDPHHPPAPVDVWDLLLEHTGAGEILLDESVARHWKERGNRPLATPPREVPGGEGMLHGALVRWRQPSTEPHRKKTVRSALWGLLLLTPMGLLAVMMMMLATSRPLLPARPVLIVGPVHAPFVPGLCQEMVQLLTARGLEVTDHCALERTDWIGVSYPRGSRRFTGIMRQSTSHLELTLVVEDLYAHQMINRRVIRWPLPLPASLGSALSEGLASLLQYSTRPAGLGAYRDLLRLCDPSLDAVRLTQLDKAREKGIEHIPVESSTDACMVDWLWHLQALTP